MGKYKIWAITWLVATLVLFKEISIYIKMYKVEDFSYFIREYFNYVYIKVGNREELNIERFFIVLVFYLLVYYTFYNVISVNIESFKNIIKYNSNNIIDYYFKSINFFGKIFLKMTVFNIIVFFVIFKLFYYGFNYLNGFIDLLKLPFLLFLALLVGVLLPVKRVFLAVLLYTIIVLYILFFNRNPFSYIFILYLATFCIILIRHIIKKIDV